MLRIDNSSQQNPSLWELVLPPELFRMNEELTRVDKLLDDERFFAPFRERFGTRMGRPTTAVSTYLRLMYLKYRYGLGYEVLVKEVSDSIVWRRFCHLTLGDRVPDSTTLIKLTLKGFRIDLNIIRRMVKIGVPASVMSIQRSLGYLVLAWLMVPFGTFAVAGHSLIQRIDTLIFLPTWAIGSSAGVLVGQNLGAQQVQRAVRSTWLASAVIAVVMIAVTAAILLWADGIVGIFNNEPGLMDIASTFLRIAAAGYLLMALTVVLQQVLSGAGDTMPAMLISLMMIWVVQLPLAYLMPRLTDFGVYGIRWALVIGVFAGAVAYIVYFHIGRWKRKMV